MLYSATLELKKPTETPSVSGPPPSHAYNYRVCGYEPEEFLFAKVGVYTLLAATPYMILL